MNVLKTKLNLPRVIFQETLRSARENEKIVEASRIEAQRIIEAALKKQNHSGKMRGRRD